MAVYAMTISAVEGHVVVEGSHQGEIEMEDLPARLLYTYIGQHLDDLQEQAEKWAVAKTRERLEAGDGERS
jgi:hypothetical protein